MPVTLGFLGSRRSHEVDVDEHEGLAKGMRVRTRQATADQWRRAGISERFVDARAGEGVVLRIVTHRKHGWASVLVRYDSGVEEFMILGSLEPVA